jgi:hypothetical protein
MRYDTCMDMQKREICKKNVINAPLWKRGVADAYVYNATAKAIAGHNYVNSIAMLISL